MQQMTEKSLNNNIFSIINVDEEAYRYHPHMNGDIVALDKLTSHVIILW